MACNERMISANKLTILLAKRFRNRAMIRYDDLMAAIADVPTEEAEEVVHGRWIPKEYSGPEGKYYLFHCSECGTPNAFERNYCHACGAKMGGGTQNGNQTDSV